MIIWRKDSMLVQKVMLMPHPDSILSLGYWFPVFILCSHRYSPGILGFLQPPKNMQLVDWLQSFSFHFSGCNRLGQSERPDFSISDTSCFWRISKCSQANCEMWFFFFHRVLAWVPDQWDMSDIALAGADQGACKVPKLPYLSVVV